MAYKSRVSNKYMGATFAGQVNAASDSEAMDLARTLQRTVNPALERIYARNIEKQKDTAKEKINQLFLEGKKSDVIQQEILEGKHPELSGRYVEKTVSYHTGRHEAIDAISNIEANKNKYDHTKTNLPAFYKEYLPSFANKDGSYTLGFAAVFNQYKTKEAINDAEVRNKYAKTQKINQGAKIISNVPVNEVWDTVNSLNVPLPPEEGQTKPRQFYSNEELNEVVLQHAGNLLNTATTTEEIDRAIKILSTDRGIKKDGTKLGSLVDTKRTDVSELVGKLNRKRVTLENQNRINEDYKEKQTIKQIFSDAFSDNEDGTPKTYAQQMEQFEKLKKIGRPSLLTAFRNVMNVNRSIETDPAKVDGFMIEIISGNFTDQTDMIKAFTDRNMPASDLTKALTYWEKWNTNNNRGVKPIHQSNSTYVQTMSQIKAAVKGNFTTNGILASNGAQAIFNATNYMIKEIADYEARFEIENKRKPNNSERQQFIQNLGKYVIDTFKGTVDPTTLSVTEREQQAEEAEKKRKQTVQIYKDLGITTLIDNLNKSLEKGGFVLPTMTDEDRSIFKGAATERKEFEAAKVVPALQNYLTQSFGVAFTPEMFKAMTNQDVNAMIANISKSLKVDQTLVRQAIKTIVTGK